MNPPPGASSRARITVACVLTLLVAPVAVQGLTRLLSAWTGEPHRAAALTLGAIAPVMIAGIVALVRGKAHPLAGWISAGLSGVGLLAFTRAPVTSITAAALAGSLAAHGLPFLSARAPVPRGRLTAVLLGVLAVLAVAQVGRMSVFMADPTQRWGALAPHIEFAARHSCLTSYVHGAELARRGDRNIYDDRYGFDVKTNVPELPSVIDIGPLTMDTYEYPPQFLPLPRLLLALSRDFMAIRALWFLLTAATFVGVAAALTRWLGGEAERRGRLLALAVFLSPPLLVTTYFGNFQVMAMALSALSMLAIFTGRTRSGAALLAFLIGAKIFPGVLGVYLLASRRYAAAAWTAAFGVLYVLIALALFGARPFTDFVGYHLPRLASGETFAFLTEPTPTLTNLGVFGAPFKLRLLGWAGSEADAWAAARKLSWVYTLLIVGLAVWAGRRHATPEGARSRAALLGVWFGLLGLGALRSPYAPPEALIPLVWGLSLRAAAAERPREVALAGVLWVAIMLVIPAPPPAGAALSLALQSVVIATAIWLTLARRDPAEAPAAPRPPTSADAEPA